MKMLLAYRKAARLAKKHGEALVVTAQTGNEPIAQSYDAVTVEEFHAPAHTRDIGWNGRTFTPPRDFRFFDRVESTR